MTSFAQVLEAAREFLDLLRETWGLSEEDVTAIMQSPAAQAFIPLIAFAELGDESGYTPRVEANMLVAAAFRNGPLEDYHASGRPIGDAEMRDLMISASRRLNSLLLLRDFLMESGAGGQRLWRQMVVAYHRLYCSDWETEDKGEFF